MPIINKLLISSLLFLLLLIISQSFFFNNIMSESSIRELFRAMFNPINYDIDHTKKLLIQYGGILCIYPYIREVYSTISKLIIEKGYHHINPKDSKVDPRHLAETNYLQAKAYLKSLYQKKEILWSICSSICSH